jgi:hypothetical protein
VHSTFISFGWRRAASISLGRKFAVNTLSANTDQPLMKSVTAPVTSPRSVRVSVSLTGKVVGLSWDVRRISRSDFEIQGSLTAIFMS